MSKNVSLFLTILFSLLIGGALGYWYGQRSGYEAGFDKGQEEVFTQTGAKDFDGSFTIDSPVNNPFADIKLNPFE